MFRKYQIYLIIALIISSVVFGQISYRGNYELRRKYSREDTLLQFTITDTVTDSVLLKLENRNRRSYPHLAASWIDSKEPCIAIVTKDTCDEASLNPFCYDIAELFYPERGVREEFSRFKLHRNVYISRTFPFSSEDRLFFSVKVDAGEDQYYCEVLGRTDSVMERLGEREVFGPLDDGRYMIRKTGGEMDWAPIETWQLEYLDIDEGITIKHGFDNNCYVVCISPKSEVIVFCRSAEVDSSFPKYFRKPKYYIVKLIDLETAEYESLGIFETHNIKLTYYHSLFDWYPRFGVPCSIGYSAKDTLSADESEVVKYRFFIDPDSEPAVWTKRIGVVEDKNK